MTIPSLGFGKLTIINPTLRSKVETELKDYASRPPEGCRSSFKGPVLQGLQSLSGDANLRPDAFVPKSTSNPGIYPKIGQEALAGLLPLKDGWGLLATNDKAMVLDLNRYRYNQYPHDDLNHALVMLGDRNWQKSETVMAEYLTHERKLKGKAPILQFEQQA